MSIATYLAIGEEDNEPLNFFTHAYDDFEINKKQVTVRGKVTHEAYNMSYAISGSDDIERLVDLYFTPQHEDDKKERDEILSYFISKIDFFKSDLFSRQVVMQPQYQGDSKLAACISFIQAIVRNNTIDIHIVLRSQNIANFQYDNQTYACLITVLASLLHVNMGTIFVKVISLHKIL